MSLSTHCLTAEDACLQINQKQLTIVDLLQACLSRIEARESIVRAWEYRVPVPLLQRQVNHQHKRYQQVLKSNDATALQTFVASHPLWGIPIAIKDIFATQDMPTAWGMELYRGRYLDHDAVVVARLRAAGAIILGKTVTTELATAAAGPTTNPHHRAHTPGGSSSGSAAAVADGMVPLAIGSQTMGSILRPAAYCGVFGFKPSFGLISRSGMLSVCRDLDHVGVFARSIPDIQTLMRVLVKPDERDSDSPQLGSFASFQSLQANIPEPTKNSPLRLALLKTPDWSQAESIVQDRLGEAVTTLSQSGITIETATLPEEFEDCWERVQTLCAYGLYQNHGFLLDQKSEQCSLALRAWLRRGQRISADVYGQIFQRRRYYLSILEPLLSQYDAIVTPATTGPAPVGLANTGSAIFCGLWTLCGFPALNLPLGKTAQGLPLGCQLVGARYSDHRLLEVAKQCWQPLKEQFGEIKIPLVSRGS